MSTIKNYALDIDLVSMSERLEKQMNQNRRETDSDFAALFPDTMVVTKGNVAKQTIKFPHTKERKRFAYLLTAHQYIKENTIINPELTRIKNAITGDEWLLEWILEEQS